MGLSNDQLKFFANYIEKQLGIVYTDTNYFQLEHRLSDITIQLGLSSTEELWKKAVISIDGNFKALLLDLATNNETSFFRDLGVFQAFEAAVIPEIIQKNPNIDKIKIWSAASSTGQEPYSLAIIMENAARTGKNWPDYSILATDVSERVLKRGMDGIYSQLEVQRGLPARYLISFFDKNTDNQWLIKPELKSKIKFQKMNLLDPWFHASSFDVIFCRNVLIYQSVENKTQVIAKISESLKSGGVLFLGAAESMLGLSNDFEQTHYNNSVYYVKK